MPSSVEAAFETELSMAIKINRINAQHGRIWYHLERAHILSQNYIGAHIRIHILMLIYALQTKNWKEALGQIPRLLLAGPATYLGKVPRGNNGRSYVPMFQPMAIPDDIKGILNPKNHR